MALCVSSSAAGEGVYMSLHGHAPVMWAAPSCRRAAALGLSVDVASTHCGHAAWGPPAGAASGCSGRSSSSPCSPGSPIGRLDTCLLCGFLMHSEVDRRYQQLRHVAGLLKSKCSPTPFVYESIIGMARGGGDAERRHTFCIACINWTRRLADNWRADPAKPRAGNVVPLDALLMFIEDPSSVREPDKRLMYRLLQNLSTEYTSREHGACVRNPYARFCSPCAQRVLDLFRRDFFPGYRMDTSERHRWGGARVEPYLGALDSPAGVARKRKRRCRSSALVSGGSLTPETPPALALEENTLQRDTEELMRRVITMWWECNGLPMFFTDRAVAKYIRRVARCG
mmetsp:Transcript_8278/g.20221  ORF Transcript_8278/g.20221 Transcript_8278/m.20221 type:complete len:341 (-) Transcript_8278:26-1048(-)